VFKGGLFFFVRLDSKAEKMEPGCVPEVVQARTVPVQDTRYKNERCKKRIRMILLSLQRSPFKAEAKAAPQYQGMRRVSRYRFPVFSVYYCMFRENCSPCCTVQ
jgi:hypothetical protein